MSCGLDQMAASCEYSNQTYGFIQSVENVDQLSYYQLPKNDWDLQSLCLYFCLSSLFICPSNLNLTSNMPTATVGIDVRV